MKELRLVLAFLRRRPGSLKALVEYFNNRRRRFIGVNPIHTSCFGLVRVENDSYGYEVRLGGPWAEMLDCSPASYGLTRQEADELFDAILSCVPTSAPYADKQARLGRMIGEV
jgi:hypothetical protein